ncbi:MAG: IS256 family transposase, partial [Spirochaetia bacterium]|nr:IS256 family transposase [Spirochaetia bacterium]
RELGEGFPINVRKIVDATSPDAAMKLLFMALQNISKRWTMPIRDWGSAMNQFAILYGDRVPL